MEPLSAAAWDPPPGWARLVTIESHTGGEPFRLFLSGVGELPGSTVLEKRRHAIERLDHIRRATILEPRGHADMYGGWIAPPVRPDSDLSVLFVHNEGFSTMCGHGIIALAKVAIETAIVPATGDVVELRIDTPAGQVVTRSTRVDGVVVETRFRNVPSFLSAADEEVDVPGLGTVGYDLAFGGAFYAFVDATTLPIDPGDVTGLIEAGRAIKREVASTGKPIHPTEPDLEFLYGVIFTTPSSREGVHSRHVCVFADGEVDRSPTGTGVSGRLAILHHKGEVSIGEELGFESIVGSRFSGEVVGVTDFHGMAAVIPEVGGTAHITGRSEWWIDPDDAIGAGFLLR